MTAITTVTPFSKRSPERVGQHLQWQGKVTMTSSYATGGDTITAAQLGFNRIMGGSVEPAGGYVFELIIAADALTALIKAYRQTNPAAAGGADVPLVQVANAVDLSAIVSNARFAGR